MSRHCGSVPMGHLQCQQRYPKSDLRNGNQSVPKDSYVVAHLSLFGHRSRLNSVDAVLRHLRCNWISSPSPANQKLHASSSKPADVKNLAHWVCEPNGSFCRTTSLVPWSCCQLDSWTFPWRTVTTILERLSTAACLDAGPELLQWYDLTISETTVSSTKARHAQAPTSIANATATKATSVERSSMHRVFCAATNTRATRSHVCPRSLNRHTVKLCCIMLYQWLDAEQCRAEC